MTERHRVDEVGKSIEELRLDWHLENWAEYMQNRPTDHGRGYPGRASGGILSRASQDFEQMVMRADVACAKAVDAILEGCTPTERAAVHHYHLAAVFRFPNIGRGAEIAYHEAREKIRAGLQKRGIP